MANFLFADADCELTQGWTPATSFIVLFLWISRGGFRFRARLERRFADRAQAASFPAVGRRPSCWATGATGTTIFLPMRIVGMSPRLAASYEPLRLSP